jgi:tetratricopeptide (TPR) repeat protein
MGLVYSVRGTGWEPAARDSLLVLSRRAISRALALDSSLAEAWLAKGEADHVSGDAWSAQQAFERSLRLDSLNAEAWHLYGALYFGVGVGSTALALPSHAIPLFRRALALDPTLRNTWRHLSFAMLAEGRLPEAEALLDTTLSLGEWDFAYTERATVRFLRGNAIRAFADLDAAGQSPTAPIRSLYALALGDSVRARAQLAAYHAVADSGRPNYTNQSRFAAMLGLRDEALMVLERLRSTPDPAEPRCAPNVPCSVSLRTWRLLHDPTFAPLHGDPRFERLWQETMPKVPWLPANEQGR